MVEVINDGAKNLLNYDAWKTVGCSNGTIAVSGNSVTITATANDAFTRYQATGDASIDFPVNARIPVKQGDVLTLSWDYVANNSQTNDQVYLFGNGVASKQVTIWAQTKKLSYTVPSDVTFITFRLGVGTSGNSATYSNLMICTQSQFNISPTYEPYALGNQVLTPAMIEQVDSGAKNLFNIPAMTANINHEITFTPNANGTVVATGTASGGNGQYSLGTYAANTLNGLVIDGVTVNNDNAYIRIQRNASPWDGYNIKFSDNGFIIPTINYEANIYLLVTNGTALPTGGITFFPMLCTQADWNVSHKRVPYRPNWDLVYGLELAPEIPTNADLNTYKTPGRYRVKTISISRSLANSPIDKTNGGVCILEVKTFNDTDRLIQELTEVKLLADPAYEVIVYRRYWTAASGGAWGDWMKFSGTKAPITT